MIIDCPSCGRSQPKSPRGHFCRDCASGFSDDFEYIRHRPSAEIEEIFRHYCPGDEWQARRWNHTECSIALIKAYWPSMDGETQARATWTLNQLAGKGINNTLQPPDLVHQEMARDMDRIASQTLRKADE